MSRQKLRQYAVRFVFFILWLVLSVPVGGAVLALKENLGINVFQTTGYHSFKTCLASESRKAAQEVLVAKQEAAPPAEAAKAEELPALPGDEAAAEETGEEPQEQGSGRAMVQKASAPQVLSSNPAARGEVLKGAHP